MEHFEGLFDKMRHRQSDKFRRCDRLRHGTRQHPRRGHFKLHEVSDMQRISFEGRIVCLCPKNAGSRSLLTGSWFGGTKLKDRSAGGWRSGLQRSEK